MKLKPRQMLFFACVLVCFLLPLPGVYGFEIRNLTGYVDPRNATETPGNCVIGPQVPWGSINPSPDTPGGDTDGYTTNSKIRGFSQTHVSGTGGGSRYGNFLVSPQIGLAVGETAHDSNKTGELAACGYYKVTLSDYNITSEVTPTQNSAIYRLTFPSSTDANILIDLGHYITRDILARDGGATAGTVTVDNLNNKISGWGTYRGGWGATDYNIYFCAKFSKSPAGYGTWKNGVVTAGSTTNSVSAYQDRIGGYFKFSTTANEIIYLKIAVSMKSTSNAETLLNNEIPAWDFDGVRSTCEAKWNDVLSTILIDDPTATTDQLKLFYTNFYHCLVMPRDRTGDCPWGWAGQYWDDQYAGWDTFRSVFPLYSLVKESVLKNNILSYIERYNYNGGPNYVADAYIAGYNGMVQGGDDVDPVIVEAYAKGIAGIDWNAAYNILKYHADNIRTADYRLNNRGWIPDDSAIDSRRGSKTVEYAFNDFNAAMVACGLGKAEYNAYLTRSGQWENIWKPDKSDEGYSGFLQPRKADMTWVDFDPDSAADNNRFYEGKSWGYSYYVPQNMARLVSLMGGSATFVNRTKYYFDQGKHDWTNEPCFLVSRLFNYSLRPDLTSNYVRSGMSRWTLTNSPGNDDSGGMGSWYVFSAMGFFPVAGTDLYLINGPMFQKITIQMENGANIVINGPRASDSANKYVQSATLNGVALNKAWFRHSEITNGATFTFTMGSTASGWGQTGNPPPSGVGIFGGYEAEDAVLSGVIAASGGLGFTGAGYADYQNASGDYIEWTVNAATAGTYTLLFRYANGSTTDRPLEVKVNGALVSSGLSFPVTGAWNNWNTVSISAALNVGNNTIRTTATGSSGGNIDHLIVKGGPPVPTPTSTPIPTPSATPTPTAIPNLVAYWKLDESSGTLANDETTYNHDGTLKNGPTWQSSGGHLVGALSFDGTNDYVEVVNTTALNATAAISTTAWFKTSQAGTAYASILRHDGHFTGFQITKYGTARAVYWVGATSYSATFNWDNIYNNNVWHHIATVYDANVGLSIYIDGSLVASNTTNKGALGTTTKNFCLGASETGTECYKGLLDDVRVYNKALSVAEVQALAEM
jgi:predicted alpha-1,2-mannosidase